MKTPHFNQAEISKFNALAAEWWDPHGPMAPLHWMNPARLDFIRNHLGTNKALKGLDLGCGAGLLTEPLARLGYRMTGADGAADALAVARARAADEGLDIAYLHTTSTDLARQKQTFDFVTALEIIEHVDDPAAFVAEIAALTKPGGKIFISTMSRTLKARALAIWGAEYLLRSLPIGTHDYSKFLKPSEVARLLEASGCRMVDAQGLKFSPLRRDFTLAPHDLDVNYIVCAIKE